MRKLTRNAVLKLNATWMHLIKKANKQCEVFLGRTFAKPDVRMHGLQKG